MMYYLEAGVRCDLFIDVLMMASGLATSCLSRTRSGRGLATRT
jgi:hypothetical protein